MKIFKVKVFDYFAQALGARPGLLLVMSLLWGFAYLFALLNYLGRTGGLPLFGWDASQTTLVMGVIILSIFGVLVWRIARVNQILKKALLRDYALRYGHSPPPSKHGGGPEKDYLPGSFLSKLLAIIRFDPHSTLLMTATFVLTAVTLKICWEILSSAPAQTLGSIVFLNIPWATAFLVATVLIFHESSALDALVAHFRIGDQQEEDARGRLLAEFLLTLTAMENQCFQRKFVGKQRNKEIAAELNISESTVKTHVNNMNKKWGDFSRKHSISMPLSAFSQGFPT